MSKLDQCAQEWFKTMLDVNTPATSMDAIIERASTMSDREGFDKLVGIMLSSSMMMVYALSGPERFERAMGSTIITALLLGAHLSKEGYL